MKNFYDEGLEFSCTGCSYCCRFEGGVVFLSQEDLSRLAEFEKLTEVQFKKVYCRSVCDDSGKEFLILKTLLNGDCIFWNKNLFDGAGGCDCYEARPVQCSTYPFWSRILKTKDDWEKEKQKCPGINCGAKKSASEVKDALCKYEQNKGNL